MLHSGAMQTLSEHIIDAGLANRVIRERQLARLLTGTPQRRHNLVNRALKNGELLRLRRGLYLLGDRLRTYPAHPFELAQAMVPGSYVSFETALSHHGWIPEAVKEVASVTPGRKSLQYIHQQFGGFSFHPLATAPGHFLELVVREHYHEQHFLIAKPERALMDLVCLRKVEWQGLDWLVGSLRIDEENLRAIGKHELKTLSLVYTQRRVKHFLNSLFKELFDD